MLHDFTQLFSGFYDMLYTTALHHCYELLQLAVSKVTLSWYPETEIKVHRLNSNGKTQKWQKTWHKHADIDTSIDQEVCLCCCCCCCCCGITTDWRKFPSSKLDCIANVALWHWLWLTTAQWWAQRYTCWIWSWSELYSHYSKQTATAAPPTGICVPWTLF